MYRFRRSSERCWVRERYCRWNMRTTASSYTSMMNNSSSGSTGQTTQYTLSRIINNVKWWDKLVYTLSSNCIPTPPSQPWKERKGVSWLLFPLVRNPWAEISVREYTVYWPHIHALCSIFIHRLPYSLSCTSSTFICHNRIERDKLKHQNSWHTAPPNLMSLVLLFAYFVRGLYTLINASENEISLFII